MNLTCVLVIIEAGGLSHQDLSWPVPGRTGAAVRCEMGNCLLIGHGRQLIQVAAFDLSGSGRLPPDSPGPGDHARLTSARQQQVDGSPTINQPNTLVQLFTLNRRPVIFVGRIAMRWTFTPGESGWGVAPRAVQETSSRAVVASTATPCTNTLQ